MSHIIQYRIQYMAPNLQWFTQKNAMQPNNTPNTLCNNSIPLITMFKIYNN